MRPDRTVMIVDDDQDDIELFLEVMEEIDPSVDCRTAYDCEEALEELRKGPETLPSVIFLDLNMPRMNGRDCLRELKRDTALKDIPIVIYTTSSHPQDKRDMMDLGASYFLTKALSFKKLKEGISVAIKTVL